MDVNAIIGNFRSIIMEHYFDFEGRSNRATFWYFVLVYFVIAVILGIIQAIIHVSFLTTILELALLLPYLGLAARRLHDVDVSAWWLLIALTVIGILLLLYWYVIPGTAGPNKYGPAPAGGMVAPKAATA